MKRRPDWPERLIEFIEARRVRAFSWGKNDCAMFAADAVHSMTDVDIAKPWRGYSDERGAIERIKEVGGLRQWIEVSGLTEKPKGFAQRGDVVLAILEGRDTVGVVMGDGFWCGPGEQALVARPMGDEVAAVFGY